MNDERDPTGRQVHDLGAKLDDKKIMASLLKDFSLALTEVAKVCTYGARKYSKGGWQHVPQGIDRYDDAKWPICLFPTCHRWKLFMRRAARRRSNEEPPGVE